MKPLITFSLLFLLTLFSTDTLAQAKIGKVTGSVKSADGSLDGVTISLLKAKDSSLAKVAVSNKAGDFEMEKIADGKYLISATAVGYTKFLGSHFTISPENSTVNVGNLELKSSDQNLGNVQVTARRPLIENKIDKMVVNVDAAVTNVGTTAMDVLEKSPGISVDNNGNLSLKGKQGVIILIDGKPSYLGGQDLANLLRNMPSAQLDQIEIMSQPSAKFDASGNSGVINIKTKRSNLKGFNGALSLSYTQGVYPKSSNSFNINSRKGKVNVFANAAASYFKGFNNNDLYRKFHNQSTKELKSVFDQNSDITMKGKPISLKAGMDYFVNAKTTVGFVLSGMYNERESSVSSITRILNKRNELDSLNIAETRNRDPWVNYSANVNMRHVINKAGREVTADVDYVKYNSRNKSSSDNYTYNPISSAPANSYLLRGDLPSDINIFSAKADYIHPLKKGAKIEAGWKSSYVETDNNAMFTFWDARNNKWAVDPKTNHFIYEENINALYVNASKQIKKVGLQLGLRMENTNAKGNQITDRKTFKRNYSQLFPTAYVSYAVNKTNNLGLSYGKRIERPNYQDLNPFLLFLDQYTYMQGNPFLTPQFSHNVEVSHNYKGQLNTALNYTRTTDIIADVFDQDDSTRITFRTKRNLATRRNIGAAITLTKPITKVWTLTLFTNIYNNYFEGRINNAPVDIDFTAFSANMNNQFRFKNGWSAELSGFFRSKGLEGGTLVTQPLGSFSFGASKQIMKTKGTLRLSVRDPLFIQQFKGSTKFDNIDFSILSRNDTRQVSLAFAYRFGKNQNNIPQRKRSSASQDEQNRVGQ
jgi:hypothetical protein